MNGKSGEDDAHYARRYVNATFTHQSNQAPAQIKHHKGNQKHDTDCYSDGNQLLHVGLRSREQNSQSCSVGFCPERLLRGTS